MIEDDFSCEHVSTRITKYTKCNGITCARLQCEKCGSAVRDISKKGLDLEEIPDFDYELRADFQFRKRRHQAQLFQERIEYAATHKNEHDSWWEKYKQYLQSKQWQEIRQRVLTRDRYVCQACLRNRASQVHHLSYELYNKMGKSAAFELASICNACHGAIHPHMEQDFTGEDYEEFESLEYSKPLFASEY
jgi:5-methylcytosine-specific restriction endonuclease McrA